MSNPAVPAPPPGRPFLTTEWRNVIGLSFPCARERLEPHLPPGAEIDALEGSPRVSLVAFEFSRTRVLGVPIPGHIRFPEINLRFYIRYRGQRGVVFLRELVPRPAIAIVARRFYNEPYATTPMSCRAETDHSGATIAVAHRFGRGKHASSVRVTASTATTLPPPDSAGRWLTDHSLGLGRRRDGSTVVYHVAHPVWRLHDDVTVTGLDVDFATIYGPEWAWLRDTTPSHVSLAAGSPVTVSRPVRP